MKTIILVKPKTISKSDKLKLQKSDYIIIEHINPTEVRILYSSIDQAVLLDSAMVALDGYASGNLIRSEFAKEILKRVKPNQDANPTPK